MEQYSLRPAYRDLTPDDPLKRDIDRVYDCAIGLLLDGLYDSQAAARNGDPWPSISTESPRVKGLLSVIAPDAELINTHCTRTRYFLNERIHDASFFSAFAGYLKEYKDQARFIVDGRLYAMGKIFPNTERMIERSAQIAGIENPLGDVMPLAARLLPNIANMDGAIGTKTQTALFFGMTAEDLVMIQASVTSSPYGFVDETTDYVSGKQVIERVNPVGAGRLVHCSRYGVVRSVTPEIFPTAPLERRVGFALTKERVENPQWPIALVERTYVYDDDDKFVHRHKEHALDPAPYQALVKSSSPNS